MDRIKIDTTVLREKSKVFETSAGVYAQGGAELLSLVASLPSYDGQLSGPARATALEVNRQCRELHDCYLSDAQSLVRTAQAFEEVDNQTINIISNNLNVVRETPINKFLLGGGINIYQQEGDDGNGGGTTLTQPFHDWNADINGTVQGILTFLPDGACEVEDNGAAPENWWDAFASFFQGFMNWLDSITGYTSKKAREKIIGQTVDFFIEYSRDSKGIGGLKINGLTVRNNSDEPIILKYVYINVNGVEYKAEIVGAPVFVPPGGIMNIKINQDDPIYPYYIGAKVTIRGSRPNSCATDDQDLMTVSIPPINQPYDVTQ